MTDIQKQLAEALDLANDLWSKGCTSERLVKACDLLRQQHRRIEALEVELIGLRNVHRQQEAREPLTEAGAAWTRAEDGLPSHGQLVLCELDDASAAGLGINFGFSVETWDEHHTLAGVVRWLPLNRLPESLEDQTVLDRIAAHGIKGE